MTTKTKLGFSIGLLATALLAACGGGGGTSAITPAKSAGGSGGSTASQSTSGAHLTFTFTRGKKPSRPSSSATQRRGTGAARRNAGATRSPKYFSGNVNGLQITVTSGSATQTLYVDADSQNVCTADSSESANNVFTCTIAIPTLGATETISALEVDQEPVNGTTTGYGTAFPSNTNVLAVGSTTATLTAGANTIIPLSFNPVAVALNTDCGTSSIAFNNNMMAATSYGSRGFYATGKRGSEAETSTSSGRIVVTAGTASSTIATVEVEDADGYPLYPLGGSPSAAPVGQPFVDVNGSPAPITVTANNASVGAFVEPGGIEPPSPFPSPAFAQSTALATSASLYQDTDFCGNALIAFSYTPPSPSPSSTPAVETIALSNNLSAVPPVFTGPPNGNGLTSYASTYTYIVVPIWASPATVSVTVGGPTATVTGYDYGAEAEVCNYFNGCRGNGMGSAPVPASVTSGPNFDTNCYDAGGTGIATISAGSYSTPLGSQTFAIAAGTVTATDTCTFVLFDEGTGVITNPVTVTVNPGASPSPAPPQ